MLTNCIGPTSPSVEIARRVSPSGRLLRAWPLAGGVSARVTALEIELPAGRRQWLIIRRHGYADRQRNPQIAATEYRLLQLLEGTPIPAPKPVYLDTTCQVFGQPYLVVEYIDGASGAAPGNPIQIARALAAELAVIHSTDPASLGFIGRQDERVAVFLARRDHSVSGEVGALLESVAASWPWPITNSAALLHGDFWLGNVLWRDKRIVGIIDWEDAAIGDPLADLANGRLELLWVHGVEAMLAFTEGYGAQAPAIDLTYLPYWDRWAAAQAAVKMPGWGLSLATADAMHQQLLSLAALASAALAPGQTRPGEPIGCGTT